MKYDIMSLTKINKEYKSLAKECAKEGVLGGFKNQIILVTDSKGHCIRRVLPSLANLKIISKSGATAADGDLIEEVRNNIKHTSSTSLVRDMQADQQEREVYKIKTPPLTKTQKYV